MHTASNFSRASGHHRLTVELLNAVLFFVVLRDLFTAKPVQLDALIAGLQAAHQWHAQAAATIASDGLETNQRKTISPL